ncbi:hypothetical protein ACFYQA_00310 [Streptomyces sp. NPDC005774]|uniref:hypothetical protein n=1 Tax=Streptomyces sp. NPDC005774 TaxID=3364728 RepID=UPI0036BF6468
MTCFRVSTSSQTSPKMSVWRSVAAYSPAFACFTATRNVPSGMAMPSRELAWPSQVPR